MIALCEVTLAQSNFDRFWVEANQRKLFPNQEKTESCQQRLREIKARSDLSQAAKNEMFDEYIQTLLGQSGAERAAAMARAEEEKKKEANNVESSNWSKEDIALLTKAIVKYPPGTARRWQVISEACGNRKQKDVIKKAQELAKRREIELEENRKAAEQQAEERKARVEAATAAAA